MSCFRNMSDREKRDVYANGLFKWFKVSELMEKHKTFDELKEAMLILNEQPEEYPEDDSDPNKDQKIQNITCKNKNTLIRFECKLYTDMLYIVSLLNMQFKCLNDLDICVLVI